MKRVTLVRRCEHPYDYVINYMRGLECIGSFIERNILYELYKIPESSELGCITSIGNCQVHPHEWHKGRKLDPPQRYPMNTRVEMDPPDSRGVIKIRIREVHFPYRAPTKKKRVVLKNEETL